MKHLTAILLTLHCLALGASDVRFPMRGVTVTPDPVPEMVAEVVTTIRADEWFILESDEQVTFLASPADVAKIETAVGPMPYKGKFAGGDGKIETRRFQGPYLYEISGLKPGKFELIQLGVVNGVAVETETRITLTVEGARPPPGPGPEPDPQPQPTVKNVSIAIIEDTMNRSPDTAILMNQLVAWTEFVDAGNDWRPYDLTTGELRGKRAIADLNGPVPGIVIYEHGTLKVLHRGLLPATFAELKALVGSLTGD